MKSKVQELAQLAYKCVKQVKDEAEKMDKKGKDFASRYLSYAKKIAIHDNLQWTFDNGYLCKS
ncbi:hypothetical protein THERU_04400 [Thermocrinis ruber]|uniref:HEPN domain-containing protein n=1 Tax=Thermocrinis ruber TaxID=75906 RepID=W0DEQ0_9AQUI|nr:hypothetical protein [Thermocrinis ruber]AHE96821.1 hypothetical protein THERU_04400 [Thermocrinis ruber]